MPTVLRRHRHTPPHPGRANADRIHHKDNGAHGSGSNLLFTARETTGRDSSDQTMVAQKSANSCGMSGGLV